MTKQPKTNDEDDEHELEGISELMIQAGISGVRERMILETGIKQGYAKCLEDVEEIIKSKLADKKVMDYEYPTSALEEVQEDIKELK